MGALSMIHFLSTILLPVAIDIPFTIAATGGQSPAASAKRRET
jgi:hypothetical protein